MAVVFVFNMTPNLQKKLDFYIEHQKNVLFEGLQGIGKSSIILSAFERNKLNYKYFSAPTMDPWVDFVGVPKEYIDTDGKPYLDLVRPKDILSGDIEVLFFDEFNRAPKKVRNAVMEIMQFKSINGFKLPKLKMVWAAINPDNHDNLKFDVEPLDPAQKDRFHIHINLPYAIDVEYFNSKYGNDEADAVTSWWNKIPEDIKLKISPRRVDYAMELYRLGGDLRDVLPAESNISKLLQSLKTAPVLKSLTEIFNSKDVKAAAEFLKIDNNYFASIDLIKEKKSYKDFFLECLPKEKLATLIIGDKELSAYIFSNPDKFKDIFKEIAASSSNKGLKDKIDSVLNGKDTLHKEAALEIVTEHYIYKLLSNEPLNKIDQGIIDAWHAPRAVYYEIGSKASALKRAYIRSINCKIVAGTLEFNLTIKILKSLLDIFFNSNLSTIFAADIDIIRTINTLLVSNFEISTVRVADLIKSLGAGYNKHFSKLMSHRNSYYKNFIFHSDYGTRS